MADGVDTVEEIEAFCKALLADYLGVFDDEEQYLMKVAAATREEDLPTPKELEDEFLKCWVTKVTRTFKYEEYGACYPTKYTDLWNYIMADNGESHGTVMAGCFKSTNPELHKLGIQILHDLRAHQSCRLYTLGFST